MAFRLTGGEYGTEHGVRANARLLFLDALFRIEPKAWQTLGEKSWQAWLAFCEAWRWERRPAPSYVTLAPKRPKGKMTKQEREAFVVEQAAWETERLVSIGPTLQDLKDELKWGPKALRQRARALEAAISEWARSYHLEKECWCVALLAENFTHYRCDRWPDEPVLGTFLFGPAGDPDVGKVEPFRFPPWHRTVETRKHYVEGLDTALKIYLDEIEAKRLPPDLKRTPQTRELRQHCEWLARYQVKGEEFKQIAADFPHVTSEGAVKMAVHRLRKAIGLPLRTSQAKPSAPERKERTSPKSGRPLGSKDATRSRNRVR